MTSPTHSIELVTTRWSSDRDEDVVPVDNPATGEVFARVQGGGADQVDAAIATARAAQPGWAARTPRERGRYLLQVAEALRTHADAIAALESREMGKPVSQARRFDLETCIGVFEYFGKMVEALPHHVNDQGYVLDVSMLEPYGVVGAILPFNWPPIHTAGKSAPALAVGNAIVIKPPEQCPQTVMRILEIVRSVIPDDVVHVVPGGAAAGAALTSHPGIDKISFTGSPVTGQHVLRAAADNLTPTLMELGGKNAIVVFDDADLNLAVAGAIEGGYFNQGEACTAASRVIVHRDVYEEFIDTFARAVKNLQVGDGADPHTHVGPLVSPVQQRKVLEYIKIGKDEGAHVVATAPVPADPALSGGYFVEPTLFADVTPSMRIATEEIFGPVVVVIPFEDESEAVAIANGTEFGLVGAIYTANSERQMRVARRLAAGMVFINNYNRMVVGMPFGGIKSSGYGREHSAETLQEYGYTKTMRMRSGTCDVPVWDAVTEVLR
ncbi:aldehyde dehydrogenase family protein [Mycobacterium sp. NPDC003449]